MPSGSPRQQTASGRAQLILFRRRSGPGNGKQVKCQFGCDFDEGDFFRFIGKCGKQRFIHVQIHRGHQEQHTRTGRFTGQQVRQNQTHAGYQDNPGSIRYDTPRHHIRNAHSNSATDPFNIINPKQFGDYNQTCNDKNRDNFTDTLHCCVTVKEHLRILSQNGDPDTSCCHLQPPEQHCQKHRFLHDFHFQKQFSLQNHRQLQPKLFQQLHPLKFLRELFRQQLFRRKFIWPQQLIRRLQQGFLLKEIKTPFARQYNDTFRKAI